MVNLQNTNLHLIPSSLGSFLFYFVHRLILMPSKKELVKFAGRVEARELAKKERNVGLVIAADPYDVTNTRATPVFVFRNGDAMYRLMDVRGAVL